MSDLNQVRIQVLNAETGEVIDSVDVKTSDAAVYLPDGSTLRSWISQNEETVSDIQTKLATHLAKAHVDPAKLDGLLAGVNYNRETGTFTFTKHDGTTQDVDTLLEKVIVNFKLHEGVSGEYTEVSVPTGNPSENGYYEKSGNDYTASEDTTVDGEKTYYTSDLGKTFLVLVSDDQTEQKVDMTKFFDVYTGSNANGITVSVNNQKQISASINDGSIAYDKLDTALKAKVDAEYSLPAATTSALGGVIVGNGIAVANDGTISADNIKKGGVAVSLNLDEDENTVVINVTDNNAAVQNLTVGGTATALVVNQTFTGTQAANATATYQWYKKTVGTDAAFTKITGATSATLPAASIDTSAAGQTIYYCVVGATGTDVVADPATSKRITVNVAAV